MHALLQNHDTCARVSLETFAPDRESIIFVPWYVAWDLHCCALVSVAVQLNDIGMARKLLVDSDLTHEGVRNITVVKDLQGKKLLCVISMKFL